jgi:hypothetical protein
MNSNTRANKLLDQMERSAGLSKTGRSALIQAANPFSDFEFDRAGFWDANEAASVVQCIKTSRVVSSPGGTGNWDCHIATLPLCGNQDFANYAGEGTLAGSGMLKTVSGAAITGSLCPVNILIGGAGTNLSLVDTAPGAFTDIGKPLSLGDAISSGADSAFLDGTSRIIGFGFEVHNTTAEIYRQGAVAVYKQPQNHFLDRETRQEVLSFGGTPIVPATIQTLGSLSNYTVHDIPGSLADVLKLSGSRQWEAADGCMVIPTFISEDIQPTRREAIKMVVTSEIVEQVTLNTSAGAKIFPMHHAGASVIEDILTNEGTNPAVKGSANIFRNKFMNYNTSGAYFTGLSAQTTLTVNVIYYLERFPTPAELDLVVIAQPSPAPDPIARLLYSEMMRTMPPGVKVADNADGDWFYELVSGAADFLRPAIAAIPGPIGMAGSVLAGGAKNWADAKLRQRQSAASKAQSQLNRIEQIAAPKKPRQRKPQQQGQPGKTRPKPKAGSTWGDTAPPRRKGKALAWEAASGM